MAYAVTKLGGNKRKENEVRGRIKDAMAKQEGEKEGRKERSLLLSQPHSA